MRHGGEIWARDGRWIRGVAALEPTFVRNDRAAVALTWLAASPDDIEVHIEGRCHPSLAVDLGEAPWLGPSATLVFADGTTRSTREPGDNVWAPFVNGIGGAVVLSAPSAADLEGVELHWDLVGLHDTVALPPATLRDAATRAVARA